MRNGSLRLLLSARRAWRSLTGRPRESLTVAGPRNDTAAWLVQLRWVAVFGQLLAISFANWVLRLDVPHAALLWVVGATAGTNLALAAWLASHPEHGPPGEPDDRVVPVLAAAMLLDLALLTALLYYSGGPNNPFYGFYFVNLALAAALLPTAWAWACDGAAVVGYAVLLYSHVPLAPLDGPPPIHDGPLPGEPAFGVLTAGRLAAFVACSGVVTLFATMLRDRVRRQDAQVRRVERELGDARKLEALGTLAAGAAHELSTPLGTIAVVSKEVSRRIERAAEIGSRDPAVVQMREKSLRDVRLIRAEVDACRSILDRMSADAGDALGEPPEPLSPLRLVEDVVAGLRERDRVRVIPGEGADRRVLRVPPVRVGQALRGLVHNAACADPDGVVRVRVGVGPGGCGTSPRGRGKPDEPRVNDAAAVRIEIRDDGPGMTPEVLARVGEPFFTTKEPGTGTGLGVFLARAVFERVGGSLRFESEPGAGTNAVACLPAADPATFPVPDDAPRRPASPLQGGPPGDPPH